MSINGQESGGGEEGVQWGDVYLTEEGERRSSPKKEAATFIPCSEPLCRWLVLGEWSRSAGARIIARARGEARMMVGVQFFFIFRIVVGIFVRVTSKDRIWVILNQGGGFTSFCGRAIDRGRSWFHLAIQVNGRTTAVVLNIHGWGFS